jgi:hypothetical protein
VQACQQIYFDGMQANQIMIIATIQTSELNFEHFATCCGNMCHKCTRVVKVEEEVKTESENFCVTRSAPTGFHDKT